MTRDNCQHIVELMTNSLKHRGLKRLYERNDRSGIRPDLLDSVETILTLLDAADVPLALDLPRLRTESTQGRYEGILGCYGSRQLADHFQV